MHNLPITSAPATNALNNHGIFSLEELANYSEKEIMSLHGMGPKALGMLKVALAELNLSFKIKKHHE